MEQLALYLHTKGIGSCYQGGARVKHDEEKELEPVMIMAFGYPAEPLERDREAFKRMELNRFVKVHGNFGKVQRKLLEAALAFCSDRWQNSYVCEEAGKDRLSDAAGF